MQDNFDLPPAWQNVNGVFFNLYPAAATLLFFRGKARSAQGRAIVQPYVKSPCHPHAPSVHACERAIRRVIGRLRGDVHI